MRKFSESFFRVHINELFFPINAISRKYSRFNSNKIYKFQGSLRIFKKLLLTQSGGDKDIHD